MPTYRITCYSAGCPIREGINVRVKGKRRKQTVLANEIVFEDRSKCQCGKPPIFYIELIEVQRLGREFDESGTVRNVVFKPNRVKFDLIMGSDY